jgi:prephenate dehydratase
LSSIRKKRLLDKLGNLQFYVEIVICIRHQEKQQTKKLKQNTKIMCFRLPERP